MHKFYGSFTACFSTFDTCSNSHKHSKQNEALCLLRKSFAGEARKKQIISKEIFLGNHLQIFDSLCSTLLYF